MLITELWATIEKPICTQSSITQYPEFSLFSSSSFKISWICSKKVGRALHRGLQVTDQLNQILGHSTDQSIERQSYQESSSHFCFIS